MKDETKHIQQNKQRWDKWAPSYDDKRWMNNRLRNDQRKLVSLLDIKENVHFLDVGCGTGFAVGLAAKKVNFKGQFYGIDLSEKMIERARSNFSGRENLHFIQANAESIPLEDNFFDVIICTNSFHHYLHPDKALREMHRLLKRAGKLYILDSTADNWIVKIADKIHRLIESEHVKMYSTKEFQQMFENAGLKYTKISPKFNEIHIGEK